MEKAKQKRFPEQNMQVLHKRGIWESKPGEHIERKVRASCSTGPLKVNYIFKNWAEDEANTRLTSCCHGESPTTA